MGFATGRPVPDHSQEIIWNQRLAEASSGGISKGCEDMPVSRLPNRLRSRPTKRSRRPKGAW
jgi:hypothetical protein